MYAFPCGVKSAEIGLLAGQRLERGRADGHLVERALAAVGLDHAADHCVGFVGAERGEGLAVEILRGLDVLVRRERTPDGARLLLHLHDLFDFRALKRVNAHVGEVGQREIRHAVVHGLLRAGLRHRHDVHVKTGLLEIAFVLRHIHADMVGVGRPRKHERHLGEVVAVRRGFRGVVALPACGHADEHGDRAEDCDCFAEDGLLHTLRFPLNLASLPFSRDDAAGGVRAENDTKG